jgi:hypothetical protein
LNKAYQFASQSNLLMTGSEDDPNPAGYPPTDVAENDAVDILNYILDSNRIKSEVETRDKVPNHDGLIELVNDDREPIGRLTVQVKKLPEKNQDNPKKQVPVDTLWYSRCISEPFLLIVVDINNERAYWKHISSSWLDEADIENQDTKTVHFSKQNVISKEDTDYIQEWERIIEKNKQKIENYDEYELLKEKTNPALGESRSEFDNIHRFLDSYNQLLSESFSEIKNTLYPDVWKFGYAGIGYKKDSVSYALYPIREDENDVQIKDVNWDDFREGMRKMDAKITTSHNMSNPICESPSQYSYNAIQSDIDRAFDRNRLSYDGCEFLAIEYLFAFLDQFGHLLGLEERNEYSIDEIHEGYYRYFQYWLEEFHRPTLSEHSHEQLVIGVDGLTRLESDPMNEYAHEYAEEKVEETDSSPPIFSIDSQYFDQEVLENMISVLEKSDSESIQRPYKSRDIEPDSPDSTLDFYSKDSIKHNIETFYRQRQISYFNLFQENFPEISEDVVTSRYRDSVFINIDDKDGLFVSGSVFWVESEGTRSIYVFSPSDTEIPDMEDKNPGDQIEYQGGSYDINSVTWGRIQMPMEDEKPVFSDVHDKLQDDIIDYLKENEVSTF